MTATDVGVVDRESEVIQDIIFLWYCSCVDLRCVQLYCADHTPPPPPPPPPGVVVKVAVVNPSHDVRSYNPWAWNACSGNSTDKKGESWRTFLSFICLAIEL